MNDIFRELKKDVDFNFEHYGCSEVVQCVYVSDNKRYE